MPVRTVMNACLFTVIWTDQGGDPVTEELCDTIDFFIQRGGVQAFVANHSIFFGKPLLNFLQFIRIPGIFFYLILPETVEIMFRHIRFLSHLLQFFFFCYQSDLQQVRQKNDRAEIK